MLAHIEHLARAGFAIHWLHPKSKRPVGDDWQDKPVASLEKLRKTYRNGNNVGVRLGKWSKVGDHWMHVIDLDVRDASLADEARAKVAVLFPESADWPTVISGSGGESRHFYLLSDKPFSSRQLAHSDEKMVCADGKMRWRWEIELYGTGKQVVIPASIHPDTGKPYRWLKQFDFDSLLLGDGPFVPAEILQKVVDGDDDAGEQDPERAKPLGLTVDEVRNLLKDYPNESLDYDQWLEVMAAVSHESSGRSKDERQQFYKAFLDWSRASDKNDDKTTKFKFWSFKHKEGRKLITMRTVVNAVREARLSEEFDNLEDGDDFDTDSDLDEKPVADEFDDLLGGGGRAPKQSKRETKLKKADVEAALGHVPPKVKRLNNKHAVVFLNGKTAILTEKDDGAVALGTVGDLHNFYENDRVATDKATEPVTKAWMRHKLRREYSNGVVFAPGREVKGAYNHWRGFSVEPDPEASCRLILAHLRKVICSNDERAANYTFGWWAHMIQRPEEKPGVAMVLRGKKGVGKDTIADYVGGLFPHHHVKIANQDQLTGKFNAHMEKCLLLHVEEGFWAGSKNAEGVLKHLITTESLFIEPKGLNGYHIDSVLRLFMSSNEKWVVPATEDERRYFVLDVPPTKKGDHAYFAAIRHEMRNGGRAGLLHYLLNYDLSRFNVRAVPDTIALGEQKIEGLKNVEHWWFDMLESGRISADAEGDWWKEKAVVDKGDFYDTYVGWMHSRRYEGKQLNEVHFGKVMRQLVPAIETRRPRDGSQRLNQYAFPPLEECRQAFETFLGSEIVWHSEPVVEIEEDEKDDFDI
ncbi:DUF5906 domain-containing protein [Mesorhizobium sp. B2-8-9]|uniref:DUF5906 domain-containing protein n=1 Tax=Mesorhizobium sp. B2-8-9 TaxID=2589899 RepID=UPI001128A03E|nr:DUF5906 domain-containing protein [Mesorhizobium sp. B2-8-9]TPI86425.1 hypothetical protein FJ423_00960 [Mesorhizobium sp. B2-8-9]